MSDRQTKALKGGAACMTRSPSSVALGLLGLGGDLGLRFSLVDQLLEFVGDVGRHAARATSRVHHDDLGLSNLKTASKVVISKVACRDVL